MILKHIDLPLKVKSVSADGQFEGYGSVFGVEDSYGDVVMPGAFKESLDDHAKNGTMPAMLWQHKSDEPIGVYTSMAEDDIGLAVKGELLIGDDPLAKRAHAHMKAGSLTGLSIGYTFESSEDWEWDQEKEIFKLHRIKLWEVSPVTFPANPAARVEDVKSIFQSGNVPTKRNLERFLRDAGFSRKQAMAFIAGGYGNISTRDVVDSADENAARVSGLLKNIHY